MPAEAARFVASCTARVLDLILVLAGLMFVGTAGIMTYSVVMRKLGHPVGWPDPLVAVLLLWAIFLAVGSTYLRGDHVNMDTVVDRLPRPVRSAALLLSDLLVAVIAVLLTRAGWRVVQWSASEHERNPDLPWLAQWTVDLAVILGAVLLIIGSLGAFVQRLLRLVRGHERLRTQR